MQRFDDALRDTIEKVIKNVFETETADIILKYIKERKSKNLEVKDIELFSEALPKILGKGYVIIEDLILEDLYSIYGLERGWKKDYDFIDYVNELRRSIR